MTTSKIIDLPETGEILLEKSSRAQRINITVKPVSGIRVAVPRGVSFQQAEQVVRNKAEWIQVQLEKVRDTEKLSRKLLKNSGYISRAAAKGIIVSRLKELACVHKISYNKIFIRNQKTRWGSCSSKKNLSINYKIAVLPQHLMDYVLLHELVHIKHLNHSRLFWDELNILVGDARSLDRQLNEFNALLF